MSIHTYPKSAAAESVSHAVWSYGTKALDEIMLLVGGLRPELPRSGIEAESPTFGERLKAYFLGAIPEPNWSEARFAPRGCLSVTSSMNCLNDEARTQAFVTAVVEAISLLEQRRGSIYVLDAGSGAIPILGIVAALASPLVTVDCLELNLESATLAARIVKAMGLESRVRVNAVDARSWSPEKRIDLLVSETMATALTAEPIVSIMKNLVPRCALDAVILPSAVKVKAAVVSEKLREQATEFLAIKDLQVPVVKPNWARSFDWKPGDDLEQVEFSLRLHDAEPGVYRVYVSSEVAVGNRTLSDYQAAISTPRQCQLYESDSVVPDFLFCLAEGQDAAIEISYAPGAMPTAAVVCFKRTRSTF